MKYCFGVDVGGTAIKLGLFTVEGELLEKWEVATRRENHGDQIIPDVAKEVTAKMEERGLDTSDVLGIGVGIPAPVNTRGEVHKTANLGWGFKQVKKELQELTGGLRVEAANDANMAAMGEMWLGAGRGEKDLIMVTIGTGVGGGIIVDGRMLIGSSGACGEIGHVCVNTEETGTCGCGLHGCLEYYASATGVVRMAKKLLESCGEDSVLRGQELNAKVIFDAAKAGDGLAVQVAKQFGVYLGQGLAAATALANPSLIIIGGGVSKAGEYLISLVEDPYHEHAFFADHEVTFAMAELGNDAGICGAAKHLLVCLEDEEN